jgi:hypothetical protein
MADPRSEAKPVEGKYTARTSVVGGKARRGMKPKILKIMIDKKEMHLYGV